MSSGGNRADWSGSYYVVWGSSMQDGDGEYVVWGSSEADGEYVVWGSSIAQDADR